MNGKQRRQMLLLCMIFFLAAAAYGALKWKQSSVSAEETEEENESYTVIQIDPSQVTDIGIIGGEGTVNLVREGENWKCPEKEETAIDGGIVESFLTNASSITSSTKIENVEDMSQYGLSRPSVNLTLQWDNNMYTIKLGDYNSVIGGYYLNMNDEDTVYVIDGSLYYSLDKTLEDFEETAEQ